MNRRHAVISLVGLMFVAAASVTASPARGAEPITVTTTEDEVNTDGDCSLREAVMAVNTEAPVDACPGAPGNNDIFLEPVEYRLTIPGAGEDAGLTGDLDLHRPAGITVVSAGRASINAGGIDRILDIHPSADLDRTVFIGLALLNGDAGGEPGGAIRLHDADCSGDAGGRRDFELFSVLIDSSRAAQGGGLHIGGCHLVEVILSSIVRNAASDVGGGISIVGDSIMTISTSTISTNTASTAGGGIWANLHGNSAGWGFELATIAENSAADGGGFWSATITQLLTPVLARNQGGNCGGPGGTSIHAVSDDDTCGGPGYDNIGLLPLTTVDGTPVHLLAPGSPAIEAAGEPGGNGWCSGGVRYDQIGTDRPLDGDGDGVAMCDAGAIEAPAVPATPSSPSASPMPLPDTALTPTHGAAGWWLVFAAMAIGSVVPSVARGGIGRHD